MPRLYVVPTPIGNLEDITVRALRVLRDVPLILAEDTRHTRKLLAHYGISTRLQSYHQHNKLVRLESVLRALEEHDVALVSNAGTPAVSDPGFELIQAAVQRGVDVDVLPGPSAVTTAVVAAGLPAPGFLFAGFLPRRRSERRKRIEVLADTPFSLVFYEAPHRLVGTLRDLHDVLGNRTAVAARELTKVHQEVVRGTLAELAAQFEERGPRGEFTLVVSGAGPVEAVDREDDARTELRALRNRGVDSKQALQEIAGRYEISRNRAYRMWLEAAEPEPEEG